MKRGKVFPKGRIKAWPRMHTKEWPFNKLEQITDDKKKSKKAIA